MKNKINEFRIEKNMSYELLAEKTGLTSSYVNQLANNKKDNPSVKALRLIAKALGRKVTEVFELD